MYKWAAIVAHGPCHVSTGGMNSIIEQHYTHYYFTTYSKHFCAQCQICIKHNPQGNMRPRRGQFPKPEYPFQEIYMDFTTKQM